MERVCLECGAALKGRADKKFCDDSCRSLFNNKRNSDSNALMKRINHQLRKNRNLLAELNPDGKGKTSRKKLSGQGFSFDYFTHTYTNKEGKTYYFCYDQGYLPVEGDWLVLVTRRE